MSAKPVVPRDRARRDVEEAVVYYAREADERTAHGFIGALQSAYRAIADHPQSGSTRYAHTLDLPGLRNRSLERFPYVVFYVEHADHVDVWRVLHAQRDIPQWMEEPV